MKINRETLITALENVKPGIAKKELIAQSTYFAFTNGMVYTYNEEIAVSCPVPGLPLSFTGVVQAEELYQLLKKITVPEIDFTITESQLLVKAKKVTAGIPFYQEITLAFAHAEITEWVKIPAEFFPGLKFVLPFTSPLNTVGSITSCIHFNFQKGVIEATDNSKIARYYFSPIPGLQTSLVMNTCLQGVSQYGFTEICVVENWVHFKNTAGVIYSCRSIQNTTFVNITSFFSKLSEDTPVEVMFPETLVDALERAKIFIEDIVSISVQNNRIVLSAKKGNGVWFEEKMYTDTKETIAFAMYPAELQDILQNTKVGKVYLKKCLVFSEKSGKWDCIFGIV